MCRVLSRRRPWRTSDSVDSGSPASAATVARVLPLDEFVVTMMLVNTFVHVPGVGPRLSRSRLMTAINGFSTLGATSEACGPVSYPPWEYAISVPI